MSMRHWSVFTGLVWALSSVHTDVRGQGPIPAKIEESSIAIAVEPYATLPRTSSSPRARVNVFRDDPLGGDRLFVNDLNGYLYSVDRSTRDATTYLDFVDEFPELKTSPGLASGFVSFQFHPEFADNGKFYTIHAENRHTGGESIPIRPASGSYDQTSVLLEWTADDPTANVFAGSRRELMRLGTPGRFHPMGDVSFDPTATEGDADYGLLHVSIGDGQAFNLNRSSLLQRTDSYLGTVLRIDPDPERQAIVSANGRYSIPADNLWATDEDPQTFPEVFAYGFRNPHRLTWDPESGALLTADIGENEIEEINVVEQGLNYGWPLREGSFRLGGNPLPSSDGDFQYPAAQFDHDEGSAIANIVVYQREGSSLDNQVVFGDIVDGRVFVADRNEVLASHDEDPDSTAEITELQIYANGVKTSFFDIVDDAVPGELSRVDLRLGSDAAGDLYLMSKRSGEIYLALPISPGDANFDGYRNADDLNFYCGLDDSAQSSLLHALEAPMADLDLDGTVGFGDFLILSGNFSATGLGDAGYPQGDLDCDGGIQFADFLILSSQFGSQFSPQAITVPEPGISCFLLPLLLLFRIRREIN